MSFISGPMIPNSFNFFNVSSLAPLSIPENVLSFATASLKLAIILFNSVNLFLSSGVKSSSPLLRIFNFSASASFCSLLFLASLSLIPCSAANFCKRSSCFCSASAANCAVNSSLAWYVPGWFPSPA